jgi:NADH:ubiquinone oxidoreductase subunit F (NADH-binding)
MFGIVKAEIHRGNAMEAPLGTEIRQVVQAILAGTRSVVVRTLTCGLHSIDILHRLLIRHMHGTINTMGLMFLFFNTITAPIIYNPEGIITTTQ